MRSALIDACRFDWAAISPAIFGALFQSVMNAAERRAQGAHYTTEKNILKVIGAAVSRRSESGVQPAPGAQGQAPPRRTDSLSEAAWRDEVLRSGLWLR